MSNKYDSLGRRIPNFNRSAASKKASRTIKERYGTAHYARIGAIGGSHRKRGYFGTLKDQGRSDELKAIAVSGGKKSNAAQPKKNSKQSKNRRRDTAQVHKAPLSGGR